MEFKTSIVILSYLIFNANAQSFLQTWFGGMNFFQQHDKTQVTRNILNELKFNGSEWECIKSILEQTNYKNEIELLTNAISKKTSREISHCYQENLQEWEKCNKWWSQIILFDDIKDLCLYIIALVFANIIVSHLFKFSFLLQVHIE
ncbi:hypothetical protein PVAND_002281 [Polypedilum vanderplanki]|uniref:Transmembrane protein n=1 Tax=Polypedilum vanderplanki TaxID=319348 RepID=A0A9J6BRZ0_POLVA|nr:hypothetical protein PVAND_002281 [Polypedilum vanderplanki]